MQECAKYDLDILVQKHAMCNSDIPVQEQTKYELDILVQEWAKCNSDIPVQECIKCSSDIVMNKVIIMTALGYKSCSVLMSNILTLSV